MHTIIDRIKKETNNQSNIIYRKKRILYKNIYIIFNETLIDSNKVSNFIIRSLNKIKIPTKRNITNKISNFKYKVIYSYKEISFYLNSGFTILLIDKSNYIALETRKNLSRNIGTPITENSSRGALDSFTENIETNIGLIKRRIKSNNLWNKNYRLGKYTNTEISLLYINTIAKMSMIKKIDNLINKIDIDGILASGTIRNLIEKEYPYPFSSTLSSEKPSTACKYLLSGNIVILVDNDPFALILPTTLNDNFLSQDDEYNKSISTSLTRIIRYITFFITLLTPAIYIALTTFNQEVIPIELLISIAAQRENVPFSTFTECLFMTLSFEILRESDLKLPSFASSAISIVGALILGEAAVSAGIVSPIMIIIVAITSISSLIFTEPSFTNSLRLYRLAFMIGASIIGIYGILLVFIIFIINLSTYNFLDLPYLSPFAPPNKKLIKNSIIKAPTIKLKERNPYLSNNLIKNNTEEHYD